MKKNKIIFSICLSFILFLGIAQDVNQFTGSLNYGLPLLDVPSNRGQGVSISASYNAGIMMKQAASEIGLGWALNAGGAITRNVSGIADDCNGCSVWDEQNKIFRSENGTLYSPTNADLYNTSKNMDSLEFMFPDYDDYFVSGPGIGGKMTPFLFDYKLYTKDTSTHERYVPSSNSITRNPQFHFNGDFADTLISRHYSVTPVSSSTPFKLPTDNISGLVYGNNEPYLGKSMNGSSAQNFDPTANRLGSGYYVEYFTNSQINSGISGFVDFRSTHTRSSTDFPSDGIGAFRITAPNGFMYHYSLPVYVSRSEDHTYPLNNDYSVPSYSATLNSYSAAATSYTWTLNENVVTKKISTNKYAVQWLLTAITGPDFADNGNYYLDDGDGGYWVSFDYQPWSTDFSIRTPHYGFDYYSGVDEKTKLLPIGQNPTIPPGDPDYLYKLSGKSANVNYTKKDIYYLNKVKTSSHTAIFVKDLRKDEVSSHTDISYTTAIVPTPQLRTSRIVLFKNDRIDSVTAAAAKTSFSYASDYDFSATTNGNANFFTEEWYTANLNSTIKNRVLKHAEFTQDYSLCRNYHGNVGVTSLTCNVLTPPATVQSNISAATYSTSGKLTLTKVQIYELQNVKVSPSYTFDYNQSSSTDNPDYNPIKTDYWGYYKSDASSGFCGYTNSVSKDYTDAWCLRKIIQPLGGYVEFDYESNSYTKVLDHKDGYRGASFIYPIIDFSSGTVLEDSSEPSELASLMSGTVAGVTKTACLPLGWTYLNDYPDPTKYIHLIAYGTFTHTGASSPYTITAIDKNIQNTPNGINPDCFSMIDNSDTDMGFWSGVGWDYSGGGYIMLQTPVGQEVYGGGPRIKRIKNSNNPNETYIQEYTYTDGVATNEADRFEYPEYKATCGGSEYFINKLRPFSSRHSLGVGIGYSQVTVKNLGRANQANGSIVSNYITSYTVNGVPIAPEYTTTIHNNYTNVSTTYSATGCDRPYLCNLWLGTYTYSTALYTDVERKYYIECFDKYSPYWGLPVETKILDVNDNVISKNTYEYESTEQGAIRENFAFKHTFWPATPLMEYYYVCILHHYPVVLKKTKSYGLGTYTESETLKRDEVTGEAVLVRNTGQNGSSSLSYKVPAFRISAYSGMGPRSTIGGSNILTPEAYSFAAIDTTLLPVSSGTCSSFLSANVLTFRYICPVRVYASATNPFTISSVYTNWRSDLSYSWAGTQGSIDAYGLYKRSELKTYPFNFSSPASSNLRWRFTSQTSLFDVVGHALETRSFNNRFNAVRFNHNNDYVSATCANSNYASFTYSGFESVMPFTSNNFAEGEMSLPATGYTLVPTATIAPHTGYKSIALATGSLTSYRGIFSNSGGIQRGVEPGRMYRAIVWVSTSSPSSSSISAVVSGSVGGVTYSQTYSMTASDANAITVGNWKRLYIDFKIPSDIVASSTTGLVISLSSGTGTGYFDDFMFYPVEGSISANVYNPGTGRIVAELNNMGYATFYTYDAAGRILETRQEIPGTGIKLVKRNSYNFARTN